MRFPPNFPSKIRVCREEPIAVDPVGAHFMNFIARESISCDVQTELIYSLAEGSNTKDPRRKTITRGEKIVTREQKPRVIVRRIHIRQKQHPGRACAKRRVTHLRDRGLRIFLCQRQLAHEERRRTATKMRRDATKRADCSLLFVLVLLI